MAYYNSTTNPYDNYWPYHEPWVNPQYDIPHYTPYYPYPQFPQARYEYRCPKCGYINVKNQRTERIVCFSCNHEFYPT